MRKINKMMKRGVALMLALYMIFTMCGISPGIVGELLGAITAVAETEFDESMEADSATVLINHWRLRKESSDSSVTFEEVADEYRFYPVKDDSGNITSVELYKKHENSFILLHTYVVSGENYSNVAFVVNPQIDDLNDKIGEEFSNFSVSSGHSCVQTYKYDPDNTAEFETTDGIFGAVSAEDLGLEEFPENYARLVITYDPSVHLIKGHAFYISDVAKLHGVDFSAAGEFLDYEKTVTNPWWDPNETWIDDSGEEKKGRVVPNPEIDTCLDEKTGTLYYNTSSGLHTNKTATAVNSSIGLDGRTYDLKLESWFSGENLADVGLILDASGSMAWTTNTIAPLEVDAKIVEKLGGDDALGRALTAKEVDQVLNKTNTDNTLLSYAGYNYYVYDSRAQQAEFVPIAYWGGNITNEPLVEIETDEIVIDNIIGHYSFENSLLNMEKGNTGATLIEHAAESGFSGKAPTDEKTPTYYKSTAGISLQETDKAGSIWLDVDTKDFDTGSFTVSFELLSESASGGNNCETPIIYIGDKSMSKFYEFARGNSNDSGNSNSKRLRFNNSAANAGADNGRVFQSDDGTLSADGKTWDKFTIVVADDKVTFYKGTTIQKNNVSPKDPIDNMAITSPIADIDDLVILVGGGELLDNIDGLQPNGPSKNYIRNVCIVNRGIEASEINSLSASTEGVIGYFPLTGTLENKAEGGRSARYIANADGSIDTENILQSEVRNPVYFSSGMSGKALDITETAKLGAIELDVKPSSYNYTISFAVRKNGDSNAVNNKIAYGNFMYIGDYAKTKFYEIYRRNAGYLELRHSNAAEGSDGGTYKDNNHLFFQGGFPGNDQWHVITYTVKDNGNGTVTITPYIDGQPGDNGKFPNGTDANGNPKKGEGYVPTTMPVTAEDPSIILAGLWDQTYASLYPNTKLYLDELYVIDETLSADKVQDLYALVKSNANAPNSGKIAYDNAGNPIAGELDTKLTGAPKKDRTGWFYMNSHSVWDSITSESVGTGKQLVGLHMEELWGDNTKNISGANTPNSYKTSKDNDFNKDVAEFIAASKAYVPEFSYAKDTYSSIPFYLVKAPAMKLCEEEDGVRHLERDETREYAYYLCCYFRASDNDTAADAAVSEANTQCSYVYYKPDNERVKRESLQFALGKFTSQLHAESPRSRISAVRFSARGAQDHLDQLVVMDWTKDSRSSGIISARRGSGSSAGFDSTPADSYVNNRDEKGSKDLQPVIEQYNYALTGGTYTWTGLKAFYENLVYNKGVSDKNDTDNDGIVDGKAKSVRRDTRYDANGKPYVPQAKRYAIIFTDGKDNTVNPTKNSAYEGGYYYTGGTEAKEWATTLKDAGYTIYCVMFAGGSVSEAFNPESFYSSKNYLKDLASDANHVHVATNNDNLAAAFDEILAEIDAELYGFTIQDYIDPRFDLIDFDGKGNEKCRIYLGPGGTISYTENRRTVTKTLSETDYYVYTPGFTSDASQARLFYDSSKDMYYIKWVGLPGNNGKVMDVEIPSCAVGANLLAAWSSTVRVTAKNDFIGGNSILTNGNSANMNYVYRPGEPEGVSSGTDKADPGVDKNYDLNYNPSKGFPRVAVNVRLLPIITKDIPNVSYMGEGIAPAQLLTDIENEYITDSYYLEYLKRYAYQRYLNYKERADATEEQAELARLKAEMNLPLFRLLDKWLKISDESEPVKSFSIPYIYLPSVEYYTSGANEGQIIADEDGNASIIKNNAGQSESNQKDVVGILTYRWERIEPGIGGGDHDPTENYVVDNTERIRYSVTVEFTPLRNGDTAGMFTGFFADFLNINVVDNDNELKTTFDEFDREVYNNGYLIDEVDQSGKAVYKWDKNYKPAVDEYDEDPEKDIYIDDVQPRNILDGDTMEPIYSYGTAKFINPEFDPANYDRSESYKYRTLSAQATYTKDFVSGALALELWIPVKELKEACDDDGSYRGKLTAEVTREFTDNAAIESVKTEGTGLEDYIDDVIPSQNIYKPFTLGFEFDYSADEVREMTKGLDDYKYVALFARATEVKANWGTITYRDDPENPGTKIPYVNDEEIIIGPNELPIGTYTVKLDSIKQYDSEGKLLTNGDSGIMKTALDDGEEADPYIPFNFMAVENDVDKYRTTRPAQEGRETVDKLLFGDQILNGLNTTNEAGGVTWRKDEAGNDIAEPEINAKNIGNYIAGSSSSGNSQLTFNFGTGADTRRGNSTFGINGEKPADYYVDDRLGIILLSLGSADLTVRKYVGGTSRDEVLDHIWEFKISLKPESEEEIAAVEAGFEAELTNVFSETGPVNGYLDKDTGEIIEGTAEDPAKIRFDGPDADGTYTARIYLKNGYSLKLKELPVGIAYSVTETLVPGLGIYEVETIGPTSGTMRPEVEVDFMNNFIEFEFPETGNGGNQLYAALIGGLLLVTLLLVLYVAFENDKQGHAGGQ